jgi:hypothetical protein
MKMSRYEHRPFLRFLDCYVLDAIGQLDDSQQEALERMQPKLSQMFGAKGTWKEIVSKQMDFPDSLPDQIRQIWNRYLQHAKERDLSVSPSEFVVQFVEENFPHDPSAGTTPK